MNGSLPHVDVFMKAHGIAAVKYKTKPPIDEFHGSNQCVRFIGEQSFPTRLVYPSQLPLSEDTEAKHMPGGMILLADIGKIDVTQLIGGIKHHL